MQKVTIRGTYKSEAHSWPGSPNASDGVIVLVLGESRSQCYDFASYGTEINIHPSDD